VISTKPLAYVRGYFLTVRHLPFLLAKKILLFYNHNMKNMENNKETVVERRQRIADEVISIIESKKNGLRELAFKIIFNEGLDSDDLANTIKEEGMNGWSQIAYYIQEKGVKEPLTIIADALRNSKRDYSAKKEFSKSEPESKENPEENKDTTIRRKKLAGDIMNIMDEAPNSKMAQLINNSSPDDPILLKDRILKEGLDGWKEVVSYLKKEGYEDEGDIIINYLKNLESSSEETTEEENVNPEEVTTEEVSTEESPEKEESEDAIRREKIAQDIIKAFKEILDTNDVLDKSHLYTYLNPSHFIYKENYFPTLSEASSRLQNEGPEGWAEVYSYLKEQGYEKPKNYTPEWLNSTESNTEETSEEENVNPEEATTEETPEEENVNPEEATTEEEKGNPEEVTTEEDPEKKESEDVIRRKKLAKDVADVLEKFPKYYDLETWEAIAKGYLLHPDNVILDRIKKEGLYGWLEVASYLKEAGYEDEKGHITDLLEDLEPSRRAAEEEKNIEKEVEETPEKENVNPEEENIDLEKESFSTNDYNPEDFNFFMSNEDKNSKKEDIEEKRENIRKMNYWEKIAGKIEIACRQKMADFKEDKAEDLRSEFQTKDKKISLLKDVEKKLEDGIKKLSSNAFFRGTAMNRRLRATKRQIEKLEKDRDLVKAKYEKQYGQMQSFMKERNIVANRFIEDYNEKMAPLEREMDRFKITRDAFDLEFSVESARQNNALRELDVIEDSILEVEQSMAEAGSSRREINKAVKEMRKVIVHEKTIISKQKEKLEFRRHKILREEDRIKSRIEPYRVHQKVFIDIINRGPGIEKTELKPEKTSTTTATWENTYESKTKEFVVFDTIEEWNKDLASKTNDVEEIIDINDFQKETRIESTDKFSAKDIQRILENYYKKKKVSSNIFKTDFKDFISKI
jgi:spore coat protein CotF